MKSKLSLGILLAFLAGFSSCVSNKKFEAAQADNAKLKTDLSSCNRSVTAANTKIADLTTQNAELSNQNASLAKDAVSYRELKADLNARREQVNAALAEQGTSLEELRERLITGLTQLNDSGIVVEIREGLLFVELPEKLLFAQGSASLSRNSKQALNPLASVLNNYPRVEIYVVGHTDTLKVHTAKFEDNWSLSTERANSVVRVLRDSYSVDPHRLMAAGRSKYGPSASNDTKEGRMQNRRIEIVLNPGLRKLWDMANQ
jgi:chemotaxis protein MotB